MRLKAMENSQTLNKEESKHHIWKYLPLKKPKQNKSIQTHQLIASWTIWELVYSML